MDYPQRETAMTERGIIARGVGIQYRRYEDEWNAMAICSVCDRDAKQTGGFTWYAVDCRNGGPVFCDDCRAREAVIKDSLHTALDLSERGK